MYQLFYRGFWLIKNILLLHICSPEYQVLCKFLIYLHVGKDLLFRFLEDTFASLIQKRGTQKT